METSDHWPCVIEIRTTIPRARVFRFENYWMTHDSFLPLVTNTWNGVFHQQDAAMLLTAKFKALRCSLKAWQSQLSNMKTTISNVKIVISFMEVIEEWRDFISAGVELQRNSQPQISQPPPPTTGDKEEPSDR
jgi:hypothetical protein